MVLHLLLIKGGMKTENGKVNQRSTPEGAEVKTENYPPPPLRSSPLSQGDSLESNRISFNVKR